MIDFLGSGKILTPGELSIRAKKQSEKNRPYHEKLLAVLEDPDVKRKLQDVGHDLGMTSSQQNGFNDMVASLVRDGAELDGAIRFVTSRMRINYHEDTNFVAAVKEYFNITEANDPLGHSEFKIDLGEGYKRPEGVSKYTPTEIEKRFGEAALKTQLEEGIPAGEAHRNTIDASAVFFFGANLEKRFRDEGYTGNLSNSDDQNHFFRNDVDYSKYNIAVDEHKFRSKPDEIRTYIEQMHSKYNFIVDHPDIAREQYDAMVSRADENGFSERSTFEGYMKNAAKMQKLADIAFKTISNYSVFDKVDIKA